MSEFKRNLDNFIDMASEVLKIGPKNLIGIDFGFSSIKVAEMVEIKKGKYRLKKFVAMELPEGSVLEDEITNQEVVVSILKECFATAKITNRNCCIGVYGANTVAKRIQLGVDGEEDVEDQVMWEAEQYVPFGIDESTVSYHVEGTNDGGGVDVLISAARNDMVERFQIIVEEAELKVKVADMRVFALANIFETVMSSQIDLDNSNLLFIDFGAQSTQMFIYAGKKLIFTRELSLGGHIISEEIQRQMGVSFEEAEDLKIKGDENGNLPEEVLEIIDSSTDTFVEEINKTISFFMTATTEIEIENCYVTGGVSYTHGLNKKLETTLNFSVVQFDILSGVDCQKKQFSDDMQKYIRERGAVAMGLAMRERNI